MQVAACDTASLTDSVCEPCPNDTFNPFAFPHTSPRCERLWDCGRGLTGQAGLDTGVIDWFVHQIGKDYDLGSPTTEAELLEACKRKCEETTDVPQFNGFFGVSSGTRCTQMALGTTTPTDSEPLGLKCFLFSVPRSTWEPFIPSTARVCTLYLQDLCAATGPSHIFDDADAETLAVGLPAESLCAPCTAGCGPGEFMVSAGAPCTPRISLAHAMQAAACDTANRIDTVCEPCPDGSVNPTAFPHTMRQCAEPDVDDWPIVFSVVALGSALLLLLAFVALAKARRAAEKDIGEWDGHMDSPRKMGASLAVSTRGKRLVREEPPRFELPLFWTKEPQANGTRRVDVTRDMKRPMDGLFNHTANAQSHGLGRDSHNQRFRRFEVVKVERLENKRLWCLFSTTREVLKADPAKPVNPAPLTAAFRPPGPFMANLDPRRNEHYFFRAVSGSLPFRRPVLTLGHRRDQA